MNETQEKRREQQRGKRSDRTLGEKIMRWSDVVCAVNPLDTHTHKHTNTHAHIHTPAVGAGRDDASDDGVDDAGWSASCPVV